MSRLRLLIVTNILAPYRITLFNELNSFKDINLHVAYIAANEKNRAWKVPLSDLEYCYTILPGFHINISAEKTLHFSWKIRHLFKQFRPHTILLGSDILGSSISWSILALALLKRIPIIRFESQHQYSIKNNFLKKLAYCFFFKQMDRFFVYSRLSSNYLQKEYHVPADKIDIGYNVGDSKSFKKKIAQVKNDSSLLEERLNYPEIMLLYAGQLNYRKNIIGLLNALKAIDSPEYSSLGLFIAGTGPSKQQIEEFQKSINHIRIYYLGFLPFDKLLKYYLLSDVFVLPSLSDMASIALTEALHSGLFSIASRTDGSAGNFIIEGENGLIINPNSQEELICAVRTSVQIIKENKTTIKDKIIKSVQDFTIEKYAERLKASVLSAARNNL